MNRGRGDSGGAKAGPGPERDASPVAAGATRAPFLPAAVLPKGGGAIRGMGEKLALNPARGTASLDVPVALSPGRAGATPELALTYDAGRGNSTVGLGWDLTVASIARKTEKGLPRYDDREDAFILEGAEDLVPAVTRVGDDWQPDAYDEEIDGRAFRVARFRPRTEDAFARVELCRDVDGGAGGGDTFWRVTTRDNVRQLYGRTGEGRVSDPHDHRRVFRWLLEESRDDRGNVIRYEYAHEDLAGVDGAAAWERHRLSAGHPPPQRYLKSIRYANDASGDGARLVVVLDYGDHDASWPTPAPDRPWPVRPDAFSSYRAGFDVRTWRLCRRILMFHDFTSGELGAGPLPRLVRSTDLTHDADPAGVHLTAVTQTGYLWDAGAYQAESLPPLEFEYTRSTPDTEVRTADPGTVENLPAGVDESVYRWVDLDGEGVPGALTSQGGAWFYKRNLGAGRLGAMERLPAQPGGDGAALAIVDIGGDGGRALVRHGPVLHGYTERTDQGDWGPFTPFTSTPTVDWTEPSLRQVDLDGDGLADLLLADVGELRWHRCLGRDGFGPQLRTLLDHDEERGPVAPRLGGAESLLLADMSGDGLTDLVRVRNGEVCYWPNLGHGRFGAKVTMAGPPLFDHPELFDPDRLRAADLDGSGTTDLLYLGRGEARLWRNQAGNSFGPPQSLVGVPDTDPVETASVVDLFGSGTSCLVWSSPKPADARAPLRYVDLSRAVSDWLPADEAGWVGHKPNLLCGVRNNLGAQTRLVHGPSTRFYLADRAAGTPWTTRLPFPVHVVTRVETFDHVARTRMVSSYAYRHGHYDGTEREFRGFGMVEQLDAEAFDGALGAGLFDGPAVTELHRPAVRTRTWFHTGAFAAAAISTQHRQEYYHGDVVATPLDDSETPPGLGAREAREARRALAGQPLRIEVYADDGTEKAGHPYIVTEHRHRVVAVQPGAEGRHAVFRRHPLETVTCHYERDPADPRVAHELTLDVDEFNVVRQSVALGYPRRAPVEPEQDIGLVVWKVADVVHAVGGPSGPYRLDVPVQARSFEVTGLPAPAGDRYGLAELREALDLPGTQRRLIEHARTRYWADDLGSPLPWGEPGSRALVHQTYTLAFTSELLAQAYEDRVTDAMLDDECRYVLWDGGWWIPSGVQMYDAAGFYLPHGLVDPFGNQSSVDYDAHHLLPVAVRASAAAPYDVLVTLAAPDYRLLAPTQVTDPNGNRSRAAVDALGRVTATWTMGKEGGGEGDPADLPGAVYTYDAWSWHAGNGPIWARAEMRERHGDPAGPSQRSRAFSDGSGRVVMTKTQAEPGIAWTLDPDGEPTQVDTAPAVRWVGSGRTVFDNKGLPVKQYEPYFSVTDNYEDADALVRQGVTPVLHYDPVGRLVRTEHPDGTVARVEFGPWRREAWDPNDTALESRWYADRGSPDPAGEPEPANSDRRAAWLAAQHANTPAVSHLDSLGRVVLAVADGGPLGAFATRTELDIEGSTRTVTDARGVVVLRQDVDLTGRVLHTVNPDAGERWLLPDVSGAPVRAWDGRGQAHRREFDLLRRPVASWVRSAEAAVESLTELTCYGETHGDALDRNLRGRAYLSFDGAGLATALRFDFKGNPLAGRRRLALTYQSAPDWSSLAGLPLAATEAAAGAFLEPEVYASSADHDALNRPVLQVLPDTTVLRHAFNEAGLLATVAVRLPGQATAQVHVTDLDYDAKGQRELIAYGNGVRTRYSYDPLTLRLTRLETLRGAGERLQDLRYTYDARGDVVEIRDEAQQTVFFAGQFVSASARYRYDALGRLVEATGREHAGLGGQPDAVDPVGTPLPHPNDAQAMRAYAQQYSYDAVGNVVAMTHQAGPAGSWAREYAYADDSNRLLSHTRPDAPSPVTFAHDAHGNMTSMPHLAALGWDHADRLSTVDLGGGGTAHYVYDGSGQRVRKVLVRLGGLIEERVCLGGYETHQRRLNGVATFRRDTVHVMDDTRRVALIETKTLDGGPSSEVRVRYQLANHLGSAVLEVDDEAAVISYEEYHPYGTTSLSMATGAAEVSAKRYRYTGQEKDDETGLYHHGARYYACWLARWTSADPAGLVDGPNLYAYVRARPLTLTDPSGTKPPDEALDREQFANPEVASTDALRKEVESRGENFDEYMAHQRGLAVGQAWGTFAGQVDAFLKAMKSAQKDKISAEERAKHLESILSKMEQLPLPEGVTTEGELKAQAAGVASGFGHGQGAVAGMLAIGWLAHDFVATGGLRSLRLPSSKWGDWRRTPGNSEFVLNAAGRARFGVKEAEAGVIRFAKGKADFSAVALDLGGGVKSMRVPGLKAPVAAGTTSRELRAADDALIRSALAKKMGQSEAELASFLEEQSLRIHHYKDDLIQLVPDNYHRIAHEGTIRERLAGAVVVASALGIYGVINELAAKADAYQEGRYRRGTWP